MYVLKEYKTINEDKIIKEIQEYAILNLKKRFKAKNISTIHLNNLDREIIKISRDLNQKRKISKLRLFLLSHYECFNPEIKEQKIPTNIFFNDCGKIFKKNFLNEK